MSWRGLSFIVWQASHPIYVFFLLDDSKTYMRLHLGGLPLLTLWFHAYPFVIQNCLEWVAMEKEGTLSLLLFSLTLRLQLQVHLGWLPENGGLSFSGKK